MLEVRIQLIVRPDKMEEVMEAIYADKEKSLDDSSRVFMEFDIKNTGKNKIEITALCESMDKLSKHMIEAHYKWKELKDNGSIISQSHRFISM